MILKIHGKALILFFGILFLACSEDQNTAYQVSGRVINDSGDTENVIVQIDNKENFRTTTNSAGEFVISGVSLGDHTLELFKQYEGDIYSQKTVEIEVNQDIYLNALTLPSPLILDQQTQSQKTQYSLNGAWLMQLIFMNIRSTCTITKV